MEINKIKIGRELFPLTSQYIKDAADEIRKSGARYIDADEKTVVKVMEALKSDHSMDDLEYHNMEMDNGGKVQDEFVIVRKRKA